jgi:WD40 repeat protein
LHITLGRIFSKYRNEKKFFQNKTLTLFLHKITRNLQCFHYFNKRKFGDVMETQNYEPVNQDDPVERFRVTWSRGQRPALLRYLPPKTTPNFPVLLNELLQLDLEYRLRYGDEAPLVPLYLDLYGSSLSPLDQLELINLEYQWRWRRGDADLRREDCFAFTTPGLRDQLKELLVPVWDCPDPECGAEENLLADETARAGTCASCGATFSVEQIRAAMPIRPPRSVANEIGLGASAMPPGFDILGEIDRGGMGIVYMARDVALRRIVALKCIKPGHELTPNDVRKLKEEAEKAAHVKHASIVGIYSVGEWNGLPYFIMEYCAHGSLRKYLKSKGPLASADAARLLERLAAAVQAAHNHNLVHRDLKPENILLFGPASDSEKVLSVSQNSLLPLGDYMPKITDFGLAKRLDVETRFTATGTILGTPHYMAPEQANGQVDQIGPPSDIYSLGVILYECLVGKPPFLADSVQKTLALVLSDTEAVPVRKLQPNSPRDLETICQKCLNKKPQQRYQTAAELARDLSLFLAGKPIMARPISPVAKGYRWVKRNPVVASLLALVLCFLLGGTVAANWSAWHEYSLRVDLQKSNKQLDQTNTKLDQTNTQLEKTLYQHRVSLAERDLTLRNDIERAEQLLQECPEHLRNWEWNYLRQLLDEPPRPPLLGHEYGVFSVAYSPRGDRLASGSTDGTVRIWDTRSGQPVHLFQGHIPFALRFTKAVHNFRFPVTSVAFSPDGKRIVSCSLTLDLFNGQQALFGLDPTKLMDQVGNPQAIQDINPIGVVKIWDVETNQELVTYDKHKNLVMCAKYSPDGKWIASCSWDRTIHVWNAETGETKVILRGHQDWMNRLSFTPDGRSIVTPSLDGTVKMWELETGTVQQTLIRSITPFCDVRFSRDGKLFATAALDGSVGIWNATTWQHLHTFHAHNGGAFEIDFTPDGTRLVSGGYDHTVKLWEPRTGEHILTLRGHTDMVFSVAVSPDGRQIASGCFDFTVRLWDTSPTTAGEITVLSPQGHSKRVNDVAFSPDGQSLASCGWDTTVKLWNARTGEEQRTLAGPEGPIWRMAFSHDSSKLAAANWDRTIWLWDTRTGKKLHILTGHSSLAYAVAFSPDNRHLASCCADGLIKIWSVADGQCLHTFRGHLNLAYALQYSPDGQFLATASGDKSIKVWKLGKEKPELVKTLHGHTTVVFQIAFHPDDQQLVSASWDKTLILWDLRTGKRLQTFRGHSGKVNGVAFHPNGDRIVSAGEDKTVRVWDAQTGKELRPPILHRAALASVAYSPDGEWIATGSWYLKGGVKIWKAD